MNDSVIDSYRVAQQQQQILGELARLLLASSCTPSLPTHSEPVSGQEVSLEQSPDLSDALDRAGVDPGLSSSQLPEELIKHWNEFAAPFQGSPENSGYLAVQQQLLTVQQIANLVLRFRTTTQNTANLLAESKREAIYHLAYGLSHELNNPLAIISGLTAGLIADEVDAQKKRKLESIALAVSRGAEMIRDLMLVARPALLEPAPLKVKEFLSELVSQAKAWADPWCVDLEADLKDAACEIACDRSAMREAIWALMRNSIEACSTMSNGNLEAGTRGRIRIYVSRESALVKIAIEDDGPGLSSQALKHCFDPYFSGRESGRGLGLGLSKAERIIVEHGGRLTIKNLPTMGCSAVVELPISS